MLDGSMRPPDNFFTSHTVTLMMMYEKMPPIKPLAIEYVKGMRQIARKAGTASPMYFQLISGTAPAIIDPTRIRTQPVAQGGIEAKIGAKKTAMKKQKPVAMEVKPVLPPSEIPAPDSTKAVTGGTPRTAPTEMHSASTM
uniref:Uncharacterized protein n=1 Tax=Photinus pyralis TaxID=7054 RepID=A0A1Y1L1A2_PHOPY